MLSSYQLTRVPQERELQAWNAADEFFLSRDSDQCQGKVLILNDPFGALTIALNDRQPDYWNDSAMSLEALHINSDQNNISIPTVLDSIANDRSYDNVVMHMPKSLNFFAWQLEQIQKCLTESGKVFVLGMVKHISKGHIELMSRFFSEVNPGRSEKKARVVQLCKPTLHTESKTTSYTAAPLTCELSQLPGCYAENTADPGALVFIEQLKQLSPVTTALDLGCGNGILSVALRQQLPELKLTLIDESKQALNSAQDNLANYSHSNSIRFIHSNGTNQLAEQETFELIVCNPPFHQGFTLTESIADKLFEDAKNHLAENGEFWVVANRHLPYLPMLKKRFSRVELKSNHRKFIVYCCRF